MFTLYKLQYACIGSKKGEKSFLIEDTASSVRSYMYEKKENKLLIAVGLYNFHV